MFKRTSAALRPRDPLPFQWLPSMPADGTSICSGSLGMDGNVPQAGDSAVAEGAGFTVYLGRSMVLAVAGRSSASMEMHLVTGVGKAPGQKVSLAIRA